MIQLDCQPGTRAADGFIGLLTGALDRLDHWIQGNGWAGYDPYDVHHWLLSLPGWARGPLFRGALRLPVRLQSRWPMAVRRLLGVRRRIYPMAMGLLTHAYATRFVLTGHERFLDLSHRCAAWLLAHASPGYHGTGWGLPVDWQSRVFIPAGTPCATVSAVCGDGLWALYEATGQPRYLEACRRICEGFVRDLNRDRTSNDAICFSYTPLDRMHVHNSNLMVAAFLAKVGRNVGVDAYLDLARRAADYALAEQREDGSLNYWGADQSDGVQQDLYHSGFEIRALAELYRHLGDEALLRAAGRYHAFFRRRYFTPEGRPLRNPDKAELVDIHGCAEALLCNAEVRDLFEGTDELLVRSGRWTLAHMQSRAGYFIYRLRVVADKCRRIDAPYIRWGQAWMMRALTAALGALPEAEAEAEAI